jgi:hypothetical protein
MISIYAFNLSFANTTTEQLDMQISAPTPTNKYVGVHKVQIYVCPCTKIVCSGSVEEEWLHRC